MEEEIFRKLIKDAGADEPRSSITDNIMMMIESREVLSLPLALHSAVKNEFLATPSSGFTDKLMLQLPLQENKAPSNIINKKSLLLISGTLILLFFLVLLNFRYTISHSSRSSYFSSLHLPLPVVTTELIAIARVIFPYLIPVSILLVLDFIFRVKKGMKEFATL